MVITGIVQPLATLPSISKLYFTHSQHASGQSLATWSIFAAASLLWVVYGLLNRKAAIYAGNIIGLVMMQSIFSSPARLAYVSFLLTPIVAAPPS